MTAALLVRRLLITVGAVALVVLGTGVGRPTVPQRGPEDTAAARAVAGLTGPDRRSPRVRVDVADALGRTPGSSASGPIDADGACSSPVPLPAAFTGPCRAHDLGYDLLRAAAGRGAPLGPWARVAVDDQLARDLGAACDDPGVPPGCGVVARVAVAAVAANSWRQGEGVPVVESPVPSLLVLAGLVLAVPAVRHGRRRLAAAV